LIDLAYGSAVSKTRLPAKGLTGVNSWATCSSFQKPWHAITSSGSIRRKSYFVVAFQFETNSAVNELIDFLKALPNCQMRRGGRFQQQSGLV
jgi:hypothetical protein